MGPNVKPMRDIRENGDDDWDLVAIHRGEYGGGVAAAVKTASEVSKESGARWYLLIIAVKLNSNKLE